MVGWRSGSAGALQAQGRGFKSLTDHHVYYAALPSGVVMQAAASSRTPSFPLWAFLRVPKYTQPPIGEIWGTREILALTQKIFAGWEKRDLNPVTKHASGMFSEEREARRTKCERSEAFHQIPHRSLSKNSALCCFSLFRAALSCRLRLPWLEQFNSHEHEDSCQDVCERSIVELANLFHAACGKPRT